MNEKIELQLKSIFGLTGFKSPQQCNGVFAVMKGRGDVFINLSPATGKSLCYELPAILTVRQSSIIFVRNNNVAQERVNFFIEKNVKTCHLNTLLQREKKIEIVEQLKSGKCLASLIYVPLTVCNKLWVKDLIRTLGGRNLIYNFVVDEAIYVSPNSASFNKLSLNIMPLRNMFPNVPLVVLTASGSPQIKNDIYNALAMRNPHEIMEKNWVLPNVYLQTKFRDIIPDPFHNLIDIIEIFKKTVGKKISGIIISKTRLEAIIIARELTKRNLSTVPYHASMKCIEREKNRSMWKTGEAGMIATTRDSAIGLNKPNLNCIIHWSTPTSISEYYLEIGKASLSTSKVLCCLYLSLEDWMSVKGLAMRISSEALEDCEKMFEFFITEQCRHVTYSKYFGIAAKDCENSCDWCNDKETVNNLVKIFNNFQVRHRLLSIESPEKKSDHWDIGVYNVQNTNSVIENLRIELRFYWYNKLADALIKNIKSAQTHDKLDMKVQAIFRLARDLEYIQFLASHSRATYIFAISSMVDAINNKTKARNLCNYIINYDSICETTCQIANQNIDSLLSLTTRKIKNKV